MCEIIGVTTIETGRAEPGPGPTIEMPGSAVYAYWSSRTSKSRQHPT